METARSYDTSITFTRRHGVTCSSVSLRWVLYVSRRKYQVSVIIFTPEFPSLFLALRFTNRDDVSISYFLHVILPNLITMATRSNADGLCLLSSEAAAAGASNHSCVSEFKLLALGAVISCISDRKSKASRSGHTPHILCLTLDYWRRYFSPTQIYVLHKFQVRNISQNFKKHKTRISKAWPRIPRCHVRSSSDLRKYYNIFSSKSLYKYRNS